MAKKAGNGRNGNESDWKSKHITINFSHNDEADIRDFTAGKGAVDVAELLTAIVDNGGSIKLKYVGSTGLVYVTLSTDSADSDYGGFSWGFSYSNVGGCLILARYVWDRILTTERGLEYLPTKRRDWLDEV